MEDKDEQLSIDVPEVFRTEDIDLDKIITNGDMKESVCANILKSLSSMKRVIQPVLVIEEGETYRLVFGQRRVLAARKAGHSKILATIFPAGTPEEVLSMCVLVENMNRSPNPASEAEALSKVMTAYKWSKADVRRNLGIPARHVSSRLKLLDRLIPEFFQRLKEGSISFSLAKNLCNLSEEKQRDLLRKERITLEEAEDAVREASVGNLIPDELFRMPKGAEEEDISAEDHLREAITCLERAIATTGNGKKEKMEEALKLLKEV
ncbi:MAG TPA: ParB/RepB/Spo0J family partition protein [Thermodesulfovibrionales bacterium]|nr:ParB/RepB/Spo0J family partition protein [Thermodesulfovibrionales bacterium]